MGPIRGDCVFAFGWDSILCLANCYFAHNSLLLQCVISSSFSSRMVKILVVPAVSGELLFRL